MVTKRDPLIGAASGFNAAAGTAAGCRPVSRFGVGSLVMAAITVAWLVPPYLCWRGLLVHGLFAGPRGGPFGTAFSDTVWWPAGVTATLATVGLIQPRRRLRWTGAAAVLIVCGAWELLVPTLWR